MLKLTAAMLTVALAGTASAAGWRSLRVDGSTEAAFQESVAAFQEKLPEVRKAVFERSLNDIWEAGTQAAEADEREFTMSDYLRQIDGLSYKDVVELTDPSGDTADRYFNQAYADLYASPPFEGRRSPRSDPFLLREIRSGLQPNPRLDGEMRGRPLGGEPGVNPWQQ